jgi:hypothetical protein
VTWTDPEYERRRELAVKVVERLRDEVSEDVLLMLGRGLAILDGPLGFLGRAFWTTAHGSKWLCVLQMNVALREAQRDDDLLGLLAEAEDPPWSIVAEAIAELQQ